nr:M28 family peptidase [Planctomycetota bacterium]
AAPSGPPTAQPAQPPAGRGARPDRARAARTRGAGAPPDHPGAGDPGARGSPGGLQSGAEDTPPAPAGTAELAEWFAANPARRPILFMTFSAEERGLNGSADFVRNGPIAKDRMWAMINMDMIGRSKDDYLFIGGLGTAAQFHSILDPLLEGCDFDLETKDEGQAPSDNSSFYQGGIPALFFFTNVHEDYHMPSDDADLINYAGEVKILELVRDCVGAFDRFDGRLDFVRVDGLAMPDNFMELTMEHYRMIGERNQKRGRMGVTIEAGGDAGMRVSAVRAASAGAQAGIQVGDQLLEVAGRPVDSKDGLRRALGGRMKGERIPVRLLRDGQPLEIEVVLT